MRLGGRGAGAYMSTSKWPISMGEPFPLADRAATSGRRRAPMRAAIPAGEGEPVWASGPPRGGWACGALALVRSKLPSPSSSAQTCTVQPCRMLRLRLGSSSGTGQPRCDVAPG